MKDFFSPRCSAGVYSSPFNSFSMYNRSYPKEKNPDDDYIHCLYDCISPIAAGSVGYGIYSYYERYCSNGKTCGHGTGDTQLFGGLVKCKLDGSYVNITGYAINRRQEQLYYVRTTFTQRLSRLSNSISATRNQQVFR